MGIHPVYGHETLRERLASSLSSGRFPQSSLLTGPSGIGKQRLGIWIASAILCDNGPGTPCGTCQSCSLVNGLSHPDFHWILPISSPKNSSDPAKSVEEARELLGKAMAARRESSLWGLPEGLEGHHIASVRMLQKLVSVRSYRGRGTVVLLAHAEKLSAGSEHAANALLKILEEPPPDVTLILTAEQPQSLLPTIRSRVTPIRVPRVTDEAVEEFLREVAGEVGDVSDRAMLAEGNIGTALWNDGAGSSHKGAAESWIGATTRLEKMAEAALAQPPWSARGDYTEKLDALTVLLRDKMVQAAGQDSVRLNRYLKAMELIRETREMSQGNINPQLSLSVALMEIAKLR